METSLFLAKVIGIYFVIMSLFWMSKKEHFLIVLNDFIKSPAVVATNGAIALILGILILVAHPIIAWDWRIAITIIGAIAFFKGISRLFCFHPLCDRTKAFIFGRGYYPIGAFLFLVGLYLAYHGFAGG